MKLYNQVILPGWEKWKELKPGAPLAVSGAAQSLAAAAAARLAAEGKRVLLVAEHETPENCHAFILDKPVVLKKGIWHQTLALTPEAQVKITENIEVESVFYTYDKPKQVYLG